ncbi:DUF2637 domain-containing protein [Streptomyces clavuligerus]|nr:DUF2637 domain-containing protein [Streptomyces clavuligerus]ANW17496.1 hypothetical protein BB341_04285 [Streptomyces clavuligerus]AXU12042.1 DUF2637 domain-containing protein [Streptomyces clavuligerus]EDY53046.1 transmembrane protein [Streptomyces clavuligerus]MBY6301902.1 DUF2637 domain-containing protein [Streptomyces clavuligerus]QCS04823.1 DUF2637 domain-containing protein [Streptomyces clavuligerus]
MRDISLSWLLPGGVMVVGILVAVVVLARGKKAAAAAAKPEDSWERNEERRRRKEAIYGTASYVLLFCCAAVAAALSFHGLVGFGRQNLGLTGGWEYLVPFGLDGAAMFCSVLAVREASHGDAALGSRLLVWTFAGAAAWFNWVHAPRGVDHAGAPHFFAGMSLSAAVLFDRALKQTRRAALREQGLVPRPLPQIRVVRWLRAPRETFNAWSLMLLEGVRTLDEAVEEVREDRQAKKEAQLRSREQAKLERARIKALNRQHRAWGRGRVLRDPNLPTLAVANAGAAPGGGSGGSPAQALPEGSGSVVEPAIGPTTGTDQPPLPSRTSLLSTGSTAAPENEPIMVDLTAEDDTQTLPRLDSLERKLKDLERQFG